jgi:hypothetical protein
MNLDRLKGKSYDRLQVGTTDRDWSSDTSRELIESGEAEAGLYAFLIRKIS